MKDQILSGSEFATGDPATCRHDTLIKFADLFTGATFHYVCWHCQEEFHAIRQKGTQRSYDPA